MNRKYRFKYSKFGYFYLEINIIGSWETPDDRHILTFSQQLNTVTPKEYSFKKKFLKRVAIYRGKYPLHREELEVLCQNLGEHISKS